MDIQHFFDPDTFTLTYVVYDPDTRDAVIIDPVLAYDPASSKTGLGPVNAVTDFVRQKDLNILYILETHAHADHLSGAQALKQRFPGAKTAIGEHITRVQEVFKQAFDLPRDFKTDGRQFDRLLADGQTLHAGSLTIGVIHTPGHTPACVTYHIGDNLFTGDALFMPDFGTGRCDFPAGSAEDLYDAITGRLYTMPDDTAVYVGHDYMPGGREMAFRSTIGEEKRANVQLPAGRSREEFVSFRTGRDKTLSAPKLLFQSVQVNIDAGRLPEASPNAGVRYLKIPVNLFAPPTDDGGVPLGEVREEPVPIKAR